MTGAESVLEVLERAGYEAYLVGGSVRDLLLGRPVHDWDITTSALPEQVCALFPKTVPTGIRHGTVTVFSEGVRFEVTTFRTDGDYLDGRHPEQVTFVGNLREDLSRRDFTVNAMAMDRSGTLYDFFGGQEDLRRKVIRCVGEPEQRFREDALRMLRALRFSAQLGFRVEKTTYAAMSACYGLARCLSAERVRDEVEKTLLSSKPEVLSRFLHLRLLDSVGITEKAEFSAVKGLPPDRICRWAGFFRACPQAEGSKLRLDKKTARVAQRAAELAGKHRGRRAWKALLAAEGEAVALCTATLDGTLDQVEEVLYSGEPIFLRDLAVTGSDFLDLRGKEIGAHLRALLLYVHNHPEENVRELLLTLPV